MEAVYQKVDVNLTKAKHAKFKEKESEEMKFINNYTKIDSDFIKCFWPVF